MAYNITSEDINMLYQKIKNPYIYIEVLDRNFKIIDVIEEHIIDDSYSIDATSEIRSRYNVSLVSTNKYISLGEENKLWIDKYYRISFGIKNARTREIHKYLFGVFVLDKYNSSIDSSTSTLSLSFSDMVAMLDGTMSGTLNTDTTIPEGADIRSNLISTITQLGGINKYKIDDIKKTIPYDLEFSASDTVWNVIATIRDLHPGWEAFFDIDGTFIFQPIPTGQNESVLLDNEILYPLVINENISDSISEVRNITKVFGKCLDADYYSEDVTYSNGVYSISIPSMSSPPTTGTKISFKVPSTNSGTVKLKINSFAVVDTCDDNKNDLISGILQSGKSYVFRYRGGKFYYQGQWQIEAIVKEVQYKPTNAQIEIDKLKENVDNIKYVVNYDSPFTIEKIGERRQTLSGDEYDNIYSEQLALERAEYENWKKTRMMTSLTLESIVIPFLTVNSLIEYERKDTGSKDKYIVKKISGSTSNWIQTITTTKYYPLYPFIVT